MAFPSNPNNGQKVSRFGRSYKFNSSSNTWDPVKQTSTVSAGSVAAATDIIPNADLQYDLGSPTNRFRDLYLSSNSIYLGDNTVLSADKVLEFDTVVQPEQLEIQVDAPGAGHDPSWLWTWEQSSLPFSRLQITNSTQLSVPLYMQGSYVINNYASSLHGDQTQTHLFKLKWIEGAGDANLVDWVVYSTADDSHPDIDGGNTHTIQRLTVNIPATVTPPTLVAPAITYDVTSAGAGSWDFTGTLHGSNPEMGPFYRGGTYTINVTGAGHPFYFTTDNGSGFVAGSYVGEYTDGVTGSRTESGTITFTVPETAPDTLYYQCGNHSSMRGVIRVKDLAVEVNENGNFVIYGQHSQDGHIQPIELRPLPSLASQMCLVYDATRQQWVPQDLATYVENTPRFKNKIKEVAGTATLVAPDGTSLVASVEIYSDSSYLPQIGNTSGDIAFVEDTQELKVWKTGTGWLDITAGGGGSSAPVPTVTSVSPTQYTGAAGTTISITGTNFDIGSVVYFIDQSGQAHAASSTVVINQATLEAVTPKAFTYTEGPLDVRVTSSSGQSGQLDDVIQTGGFPLWDTPAGTLYENAYAEDVASGDNSYRLGMAVDETIQATDPEGQIVSYEIVSGSLPTGTTFNQATGNISGTLPSTLSGDTVYTFAARPSDNTGNIGSSRTFNIIVKNQGTVLYPFSQFTFTTGDTAGPIGPTKNRLLAQSANYTNESWVTNSDFFNVLGGDWCQGVQIWTVPASANYTLTVAGSSGTPQRYAGSSTGGPGAIVQATMFLTKGTKLCIAAGQFGQMINTVAAASNDIYDGGWTNFSNIKYDVPNTSPSANVSAVIEGFCGGGGASWVGIWNGNSNTNGTTIICDTPLIVAGAGGSVRSSASSAPANTWANPSLTSPWTANGGGQNGTQFPAGSNGTGAFMDQGGGRMGSGGSGFLENATGSISSDYGGGTAPQALKYGGRGAWMSSFGFGNTFPTGGFGGGGFGGWGGSGGGGGYSGGGNGGNSAGFGGGGGSSYVTSLSSYNVTNITAAASNKREGYITITKV